VPRNRQNLKPTANQPDVKDDQPLHSTEDAEPGKINGPAKLSNDHLAPGQAGDSRGTGYAATSEAPSSLERPEDVVGQRGVEVIRDGEGPGGQAERPRTVWRRGERAEFGHRPAVPGDDDSLAGLDTVEEAVGVALQILQCDGTHGPIIASPRGHGEAQRRRADTRSCQ
jgi:hypothetical protein